MANIEHDDDLGAELSGMEQDILAIHDALVDAGLPGAINAESIIERIGHLKGAVEALRDIAEPSFDAERLRLSIIARDALRAMGVPLRSERGSRE